MSSKQGTSRQGSSNRKAGAGNINTQKTVDTITKQVKKDLGIVTMTGYKPNESSTVVATKAQKPTMFGSEVSRAVNEKLNKRNNAFIQEGGQWKRVDPDTVKDKSKIKWSYTGTKKSNLIKYGQSGGAMGSGDKTGVMGSIPISKQMYESQQKTKIALGVGAAAMGAPTGGLIYSGVSYLRKGAYDNYLQKFYGRMSDTSSLGIKRKVETDTKKDITRNEVNQTSTDYDDMAKVDTTKFKKKKAGQGTDTLASTRSLFKKSNKTITGYMAT